jgi:hypothetical protein
VSNSQTALKPFARLAEITLDGYIAGMNWLTKSEQKVLLLVVGVMLTGWAIMAYRAAHSPTPVVQAAQP